MTDHNPHHSAAGPAAPHYHDINTSLIVTVGIVSAIITYLSVVLVQGLTYQLDMNMIRQRSHDVQYTKSVELQNNQKRGLEANADLQRISIDQAMAETVTAFSNPSAQAP
jgi:hypothetical protein